MNKPDRIILGHNAFFGVNHMSSERGAERDRHFSDVENVIKVIRFAREVGAGGMMLSTHVRAKEIAAVLRKDKALAENLRIYVLLPYIAKYVRAANERGMINVVTDTLKQASWAEGLSIAFKGGVGLLTKDPIAGLKGLIDVELLPFKGLNVAAVFLHNVLTDLALGLKTDRVLEVFTDHISSRYGVEPGYCTLNFASLSDRLAKVGIDNPLVMAPFNKKGFQMNPSREASEAALEKFPTRLIAMTTLASGALEPTEAYEYLGRLRQVSSVVVGASSQAHIKESFEAVKKNIQ